MTIVIVIPSLRRGGAERVAANMALYWARQGMRVVVVTLDRPGPDEYDLGPAVSRVGLDLLAASAGIMQAIANNLRRLFALRRTVRAHRPDVVIGFMLSANVLVALACQGLRIRSIGCERTHPPADTPGRAWQAARRLTYRLLSAVTAQTQRSADWLSTHASPRRMAIIPNPLRWPIHPGEPVVGPGTFCGAGRQIILGVGRLSAEKGFARLLDAFATICGSRPDWDLIILGEGPDRAALERQSRNLGIAHRLKLPGAVGNIADWYDRASIFALSSLIEGFPNALAEAMASGLSVVSFDCETGPREIIRHGVDGLLVPVGDTAALADNLAALMDDASLRNQLAARAVEIRERLSEDRVMQEWDRLFQAIGVGTSDTRSRCCATE